MICDVQSVDIQREESDSLSPARDGGASRSQIETFTKQTLQKGQTKYYLEADTQ